MLPVCFTFRPVFIIAVEDFSGTGFAVFPNVGGFGGFGVGVGITAVGGGGFGVEVSPAARRRAARSSSSKISPSLFLTPGSPARGGESDEGGVPADSDVVMVVAEVGGDVKCPFSSANCVGGANCGSGIGGDRACACSIVAVTSEC